MSAVLEQAWTGFLNTLSDAGLTVHDLDAQGDLPSVIKELLPDATALQVSVLSNRVRNLTTNNEYTAASKRRHTQSTTDTNTESSQSRMRTDEEYLSHHESDGDDLTSLVPVQKTSAAEWEKIREYSFDEIKACIADGRAIELGANFDDPTFNFPHWSLIKKVHGVTGDLVTKWYHKEVSKRVQQLVVSKWSELPKSLVLECIVCVWWMRGGELQEITQFLKNRQYNSRSGSIKRRKRNTRNRHRSISTPTSESNSSMYLVRSPSVTSNSSHGSGINSQPDVPRSLLTSLSLTQAQPPPPSNRQLSIIDNYSSSSY